MRCLYLNSSVRKDSAANGPGCRRSTMRAAERSVERDETNIPSHTEAHRPSGRVAAAAPTLCPRLSPYVILQHCLAGLMQREQNTSNLLQSIMYWPRYVIVENPRGELVQQPQNRQYQREHFATKQNKPMTLENRFQGVTLFHHCWRGRIRKGGRKREKWAGGSCPAHSLENQLLVLAPKWPNVTKDILYQSFF